MIQAKSLSKYFGDVEAVRDLSFSIPKGEIVGLLGPNGAGKTTTMRMLTTFIPPTSGEAEVAGYCVRNAPTDVRRSIGYLPETPPLYPELSVSEYLQFVGRVKGMSRKGLKGRIDDILERCGLGDVRQRLCGQLSKGYRQRVGLAQALIHDPPVIILDEPTSGLDPAQIIEMRKTISSLRKDHTVVLSTHILQEVTELCSRVIIISSGKLVVEGEVEELTQDQSLEQRFLSAVAGGHEEQQEQLSQ